MAEGEKSVMCGSCQYESIARLAAKWCTDCSEGYCDSCLKSHKVVKVSRDHHIISITDYSKTEQLFTSQTCTEHSKPLDFFCRAHDCLVCITCAQTEHGKCTDLLPLNEAAKDAKSSTALADLERSIAEILQHLDNASIMVKENKDDITDQENSAQNAMLEFRGKINKQFNELERKLLAGLNTKCHESKNDTAKIELDIAKKRRDITALQTNISEMKQFGSNSHVFIGIRRMTTAIAEEKKIIASSFGNIPKHTITVKYNTKIVSLLDQIDSLGEVCLERGDRRLCLEEKVVQAQFPLSAKHGIDNIQLKLKTNFKLKVSDNSVITCCLILPNKQLMFSDCVDDEASLQIHNEDGSFCRDLKFPFKVFDATIIDETNIVVSPDTLKEKHIYKINIKSGKHRTFVSNCAKKWSWGISRNQNKIYFIAYEEGIKITDIKGKIVDILPVYQGSVRNIYNITTNQSEIYYSDQHQMVHCINHKGEVIWETKDKRFEHKSLSASLAVDKHGNVFAAGNSENLLVVISGDGQYTRALLDSSDGLSKPNCVYFDRDNDRLLICNENDGHAALYDVLYLN